MNVNSNMKSKMSLDIASTLNFGFDTLNLYNTLI